MSTHTSRDNIDIHEIRNCLNQISMTTELAKLLVESGGDKAEITSNLSKVLAACDNISQKLNIS